MPQFCKTCKAPVAWGVTQAGHRMPLDAEPVDLRLVKSNKGLFFLRDGTISAVPASWAPGPTLEHPLAEPVYRSHFASCRFADQHRRR